MSAPTLTDCARLIRANVAGDEAALVRLFGAIHPAPLNPADLPEAYGHVVGSLAMMTAIASGLLRDLARCKNLDEADYARALVRTVQQKEAAAG